MYLSWTTIEPVVHDRDIARGAQGLLPDPAFVLARQWQLGEFDGFDGGAPVTAFAEHAALDRATVVSDDVPATADRPAGALYAEPPAARAAHMRNAGAAAGRDAVAVRLGRALARSVEAALEARRDRRLRSDWRRFLRAFPAPEPTTPQARLRAARGLEIPDGVAILAALSNPAGPRPRTAALTTLLNAWHAEIGAIAPVAARDSDDPRDPFEPRRLEHEVVLQHGDGTDGGGHARVTLRGPEERPHWWHVEDVDVALGDDRTTDRLVPTRLSFPGMPTDRFWQITDDATDWQATEAGPTDLPRLLLAAMVTELDTDRFVLPLTVPRAGVVAVTRVLVRDGFGEVTTHEPTDGAIDLWGTRMVPRLGTLADFPDAPPLRHEAVEVATVSLDPAAPRGWLVERRIPGADGRGHRLSDAVRPPDPPATGGTPVLDLRTPPPENWAPLIPDDDGDLVPRTIADPEVPTRQRGVLASTVGRIARWRVPPDGLSIERGWRLGRDAEGRPVLWVARSVRPGGETRAGGLTFDRLTLASDRP